MRRRNLLLVVIASSCALSPVPAKVKKELPPKNIILMIGDGMGVAHITAARYVKGLPGMERFRTMGLATTHTDRGMV